MLCTNIPAGATVPRLLYAQEPGRRVIIAAPARQIATIPGRVEYLWHAVKGALNQSRTLIISRSTVTV